MSRHNEDTHLLHTSVAFIAAAASSILSICEVYIFEYFSFFTL